MSLNLKPGDHYLITANMVSFYYKKQRPSWLTISSTDNIKEGLALDSCLAYLKTVPNASTHYTIVNLPELKRLILEAKL